MKENTAIKRIRITAIILLFVIGLNALAAGYGFIVDPSGKGLGMTIDYLAYSPFDDFLIPGITLFFANGVLSMVIAIIAIRKQKLYPKAILLQGIILCVWIIIQVIFIRFFTVLHFVCLTIGLFLIIAGRYLVRRKKREKPDHATQHYNN